MKNKLNADGTLSDACKLWIKETLDVEGIKRKVVERVRAPNSWQQQEHKPKKYLT